MGKLDNIDPEIGELMGVSPLAEFIPQEDIPDEGRWAIQQVFHYDPRLHNEHELKQRVAHLLNSMYDQAGARLVRWSIALNGWMGVKTTVEVIQEGRLDYLPKLRFVVFMEIMAIMPGYVIPREMHYDAKAMWDDERMRPTETMVASKRRPIEFQCGYCATPNPIKHRHCSKCGAPRALLIDEL